MTNRSNIEKSSSFEFLLVESSAIFTVAKIFSLGFTFLAFSLLARRVPPEIFGEIDFLLSGVVFLVNLSIFGQDQALGRLINDPISSEEKNNIAFHGFLIQIIYALLIITFISILIENIDYLNGIIYSSNSRLIIYVMLAQVPFQVLTFASLGLLQWSIHRRSYILISILSSVIPAVILISSIILGDTNLLSVLICFLLSRLIVSIIAIYISFKRNLIIWPKDLDLSLYKRLIIFSLPLGLVVGLETFSPLLERFLVRFYLNEFDLGQFALAARICSFITLFGAAFATAYGPYSLRFYNYPSAKKSFKLIFKVVVLFSCFAVILLSVYSQDIVWFFAGNNFLPSTKLLLPLSVAACIDICDNVTGIGLFIKKNNIYFLFSYLLFIFVFTSAFIILKPYYGLISIGWSIVLAQLLKAATNTIFSNRFYSVNWQFQSIMLPIIFTLLVSIFISINSLSGYYSLKLIIFMVSISIVSYLFKITLSSYEKLSFFRIFSRK
ncbi:oligosaccharide flippase family protein [Prochlorococcus marinus]|uniref:oligosaccharide flippase family protein n=1 Tax=Prochlorococcus marinus TaxID=1219 RepID=UPI0022B578A3|nr:oligosaccharide flippase family protein [Prochlorococcus marinus]